MDERNNSVEAVTIHYTDERELAMEDVMDMHSRCSESSMTSFSGSELTRPFKWTLAIDINQLWFCCEIPHSACNYESGHSPKDFVEGLWDRDVAELFITSSQKKHMDTAYQEFNFSPAGAWWSCKFMQYRQPDMSAKLPKCNAIRTVRSASSWMAIAAIDIRDCEVVFDETSLVHITAIYHDPLETYLTSFRNKIDAAPDFHNISYFSPVLFIPV